MSRYGVASRFSRRLCFQVTAMVMGKPPIDEVQRCINQFLDITAAEPCNDLNNDGQVTIDEVQRVINAFLGII